MVDIQFGNSKVKDLPLLQEMANTRAEFIKVNNRQRKSMKPKEISELQSKKEDLKNDFKCIFTEYKTKFMDAPPE